MYALFILTAFLGSIAGEAAATKSAAESVCEAFSDKECPASNLSCLSSAFRSSGLTQKEVGGLPKNSEPAFAALGFTNLLATNKEILQDADSIPDGTVFVLKKVNRRCGVNEDAGNVALKCQDKVIIRLGRNSGSMDLKTFLTSPIASCVVGAMVHPKLRTDRSQTNKAAKADRLDLGQGAKGRKADRLDAGKVKEIRLPPPAREEHSDVDEGQPSGDAL